MKRFNKLFITLLLLVTITISCQDEDLLEINNPTWETGVNTFGQIADGSAANFIRGDESVDLTFDWRWISVDQANTITSVDFYVSWSESYVNVNGDAAVANHGSQLVSTATPGGNREDITFTLTQADLAAAFAGTTYNYDDGNDATVDVFTYAGKPTRDVAGGQAFIDGDSFILTWSLTGSDGRVFEGWSPSVCTEVPGSNCQIAWIVECGQVLKDPSQTFALSMQDSYGDGWNGGALAVIVDGVSTEYTISSAQGAANDVDVTVPDGATSVQFEYISGDWDSEVTFSITTESGNVIAKYGPSPPVGILTLDLCKENE
ncbi:hypothetical protein [Fulvivirga lutimaris]|uniref:hypothetical protein n=1 Tax=Fulvivirga lutimaris TaxID=1819566 RepID=UPI0012BB5265|nr:hypothetical protein [Fulvivirga lutimaris]MTI38518.1 hypothetical protein [Fulvivirga lutimaris]